MYTRRRSPLSNPLVLLMIGVLAGVIYVIYTGSTQPTIEPITLTPAPTSLLGANPTVQPSAMPTADIAGLISKGEIYIPDAGVSASIIDVFLEGESWDVTQLGMNVGHLEGTAWFDKPGNVGLSGHVQMTSGDQGIFGSLRDLTPGDSIYIMYQGEERVYTVSELKIVQPEDLTPLYPTDKERLTLITCEKFDFLQNAYLERVVVVAERTS